MELHWENMTVPSSAVFSLSNHKKNQLEEAAPYEFEDQEHINDGIH